MFVASVPPYQVVFSSQAWERVGRMPYGTFMLVQKAIDEIAREGNMQRSSASVAKQSRLTVGPMNIIYERDDARQLLTVMDIVQMTPNAE